MNRFRNRFHSIGSVAGLVALVLVSSGTAVAADRHYIDSGDIKNHTIKSADLAKGAVTSKVIADGTITGLDIKDGSLTHADIKKGSLTGSSLAADTVRGAQIDESTLGLVPRAHHADQATNATTVNGVSTRIEEYTFTSCNDDNRSIVRQEQGFTVTLSCAGALSVSLVLHARLYVESHKFGVDYHAAEDRDQYSVYTYLDDGLPGDDDNYDLLGTADDAFGDITVVPPTGHATTVQYVAHNDPNTTTFSCRLTFTGLAQ